MSKYKLIYTYPGSPLLGAVVAKSKSGYDYINHPGKCRLFSKEEIEGFPKFWEKVEEKEYEILSYYAKNISGKGDYCVDPEYIWYETSKGNGKWSRKGHITGPYTTDEINNHSGYCIHSIKRLSDGEVFTVGDDTNKGTIVSFQNYTTTCHCRVKRGKFDIYDGDINSLKHVKQPLFTTEDGVDIYKGDNVVPVNLDSLKILYSTPIRTCKSLKDGNYKHFSTKEAAKQWIIENKPIYSKKQIRDAIIYAKRNQNPYPDHLDTSLFCSFLKID